MASYCEVSEVGTLGINADAIEGIDPPVIQGEIDATSALMDTYFDDRFVLPLTEFDLSIRKCCAVLTGISLLRVRGYNPEADPSVSEASALWMRWLEKVATGVVRPKVSDSSPTAPTTGYEGTRLVSSRSRGLTVRGTTHCRQPFQGD